MTNTANGGWFQYADSTRPRKFFRACDRASKTATIKSGQVLKEGTFLQADPLTGKLIAHGGMVEKALVTYASQASGATVISGGLTFTLTSAASAADLVAAWSNLTAGMTASQANAANPSSVGSFTSGTFSSNYNTYKSSTADSVLFVAVAPNVDATNIAAAGTATGNTVSITAFPSTTAPIAGVLMYDVNASSGDKDAEVFIEASFWADYLKWYNDPKVDFVTNSDFTTTVCTDYHTGALTDILKKLLVNNSEFHELGFLDEGEKLLLNRGELV